MATTGDVGPRAASRTRFLRFALAGRWGSIAVEILSSTILSCLLSLLSRGCVFAPAAGCGGSVMMGDAECDDSADVCRDGNTAERQSRIVCIIRC